MTLTLFLSRPRGPRHRRSTVAGAVAVAIAAALATAAPPARADEADADRVRAWLTGTMDRSAQVARDRDAINVTMVGCPMAVAGSGDRWLYQEQFVSGRAASPYRQRFLKIVPTAEGALSETYVPIALEPWVNFCDRPLADRIAPAAAARPGHCTVTLRRDRLGNYLGTTQPGGCPTTARGAATVVNEIYLTPDGMDTRDRGYDRDGNQLWGSDGTPYEFRRVPPATNCPPRDRP